MEERAALPNTTGHTQNRREPEIAAECEVAKSDISGGSQDGTLHGGDRI